MLKVLLLSVAVLCFLCVVTETLKTTGCPTLKLNFGLIRYRQKGKLINFRCHRGYVLVGEKYSLCVKGSWDTPLPKCVRGGCKQIYTLTNGVIVTAYLDGVTTFFCNDGYDLRGPNRTYCDGYTWNNKLPSCIESNTKPALSCDFDSEDLCGWNNDVNHNFEWQRRSFDHIKGEKGYYVYMEPSSKNENDTARLISPIYEKMNDTNVCLEFSYYMNGTSTGQLRVYLKKQSDSWDLEPSKALFSILGPHSNQWLRSLTQIGSINEDFQIVIEGVGGTSNFSEIAIDNVTIIQNCIIEDGITTESDVVHSGDPRTTLASNTVTSESDVTYSTTFSSNTITTDDLKVMDNSTVDNNVTTETDSTHSFDG